MAKIFEDGNLVGRLGAVAALIVTGLLAKKLATGELRSCAMAAKTPCRLCAILTTPDLRETAKPPAPAPAPAKP